MAFSWDDANIDHIARHGITPEEAEEAVTDPRAIPTKSYRGPTGEPRNALVGQTSAGRYLAVVLTRRASLLRVVTARDATSSEKRRYKR